jgi:ArsR family transcriptional regulator
MNTALILKSIADDTRLSIIRKLASQSEEVACTDIVKDCSLALKLSQPTMSHHFARLAQSGVILERKVGKEKYYQLNEELLTNVGIDPHKL